MATQHICARCGHEDTCEYGSWHDRHPVAATLGALFALMWMCAMFDSYPVTAAVVTAIGGAGLAWRVVRRDRMRRDAIAARATWEHQQLMARQIPQPVVLPPRYEPPTTTPIYPAQQQRRDRMRHV